MFARQCGKTFTATLEIVLDCLETEAQARTSRWVILSRGERQAREAMEEGIKRHLGAFKAAFDAMEYDWEPEVKALEVRLPGGSRITAIPANPDTARGFSANLLLDEFAFHKDSRKIWQAVFPIISRNELKLRVISTPNGKSNKFYDLMTADETIWSKHTTDIHQAVADGLPRNIEQLKAGVSDDDVWSQEYELKWLDEASAWLDYELINGVEHDHAGIPDHYNGGICYIGNDIAARNDLWVAWVWEKVGDVLWTREIRVLKRASFAEQDRNLDELMARYNVLRLCMDQTGMGEKPVEDAMRRYGSHRVEGILFTGQNKQILAVTGKQMFEDRKVRIPLGDNALRMDLHKLRKVTTPTGNVRFEADADSTGHADRAWACFLGIYAASTPAGPVEYKTLNKRRFAVHTGAY
ncbi:MAG TPA: terminase [Syntrophaceae bacterium]|nr:terminase [Syntrophaceae bacterium]